MADPTGTIGLTERANSLQNILTTRLEFEAGRQRIWGQFPVVPPEGVISGPDAGRTVDIRYQKRMALQTSTINEKADITPVTVGDDIVSVTIDEYGNAVQNSRFGELLAKGDLRSEMAQVIAENNVASIDRIMMREYIGAPVTLFANGNTARTGLDATNDTLISSNVGLGFIGSAVGMLRSNYAPGFSEDVNGQSKYATVAHTAIAQDFRLANGFLAALQNREGQPTIFNGELGEFFGLRVMESPQGKMYPGAGATAQSATTITSSVTAGDVTITVGSATGLAVGNIITLGAVETDDTDPTTVENLLITNVASLVLTVVGTGNVAGNVALPAVRYDHASGVAVTEAADVGALPVFGPMSMMMAHSAAEGPTGRAVVTGPFDTLGRFVNLGWYAVFGVARTRGLWIVKLEIAASESTILINE